MTGKVWCCVAMRLIQMDSIKRYVTASMNLLPLYIYVSYSSAHVDATNLEPPASSTRPKKRPDAYRLAELLCRVLVAGDQFLFASVEPDIINQPDN